MFIDSRRLKELTPVGGAEMDFSIIIQDHFRSSDRRRSYLICGSINMAHLRCEEAGHYRFQSVDCSGT